MSYPLAPHQASLSSVLYREDYNLRLITLLLVHNVISHLLRISLATIKDKVLVVNLKVPAVSLHCKKKDDLNYPTDFDSVYTINQQISPQRFIYRYNTCKLLQRHCTQAKVERDAQCNYKRPKITKINLMTWVGIHLTAQYCMISYFYYFLSLKK